VPVDLSRVETLSDGCVVVCGAGAAGLAAALAANRCDADVLLLESAASLGGTVANALIHTIGGLFDSSGEFLNDGLPRELVERLQAADSRSRRRSMGRVEVLQVCPNVYRQTVERWVAQEQKVTVCRGAKITAIHAEDGHITQATIEIGTREFGVHPHAVIDATGTAAVARLLEPSNVIEDGQNGAGGLIFRLRNVVTGTVEFPKSVGLVRAIRAAADSGALPPVCRHTWIDVGLEPDEAFVKLLVPLQVGLRYSVSESDDYHRALAAQSAVVSFLRQFSAFQDAIVDQTGSLGIREGGRVAGRYTLTGEDVRAGRTFTDGVCRCAWPIEYWDAERGVTVEYLPNGTTYQIPMRCMQLPRIDNYWAVGKCFSADRVAHASARVAGSCWAMGQAAGIAAVGCRQEERVFEHEPISGVSSDGASATRPSRNHHHECSQTNVLPRAGRSDCQHQSASASSRSGAG
jgi:hypothetical protein